MKPIRGGLLSGVGAIVALLALSPATSWATFPGANGRIAYSCYRYYFDPPGICKVLPDGSGIEKLADLGRSPSWSADGRNLVFVRQGQLVTMDANGGSETQITHGNAGKGSPSFSPNGRRIVFAKQVGGYDTPARVSLWKVRTDGTDGHRIVSDYATSPMYSPSGRRIVFQGRPRSAARDGIWKIRPDGSHLRRLTNAGTGHYDKLLDWSPDGDHILFVRHPGDTMVMRADGSHLRRLTTWPLYGAELYSPLGDQFALVTGEYENVSDSWMCLDIYAMGRNGSDLREVTHNCRDFGADGEGYAFDPSWQPIPQP